MIEYESIEEVYAELVQKAERTIQNKESLNQEESEHLSTGLLIFAHKCYLMGRVLSIVREYPDFDEGGILPDLIDAVLTDNWSKIPEITRELLI